MNRSEIIQKLVKLLPELSQVEAEDLIRDLAKRVPDMDLMVIANEYIGGDQ